MFSAELQVGRSIKPGVRTNASDVTALCAAVANYVCVVVERWGDGGGGHWLLRMVSVSASVNLTLHHKV